MHSLSALVVKCSHTTGEWCLAVQVITFKGCKMIVNTMNAIHYFALVFLLENEVSNQALKIPSQTFDKKCKFGHIKYFHQFL